MQEMNKPDTTWTVTSIDGVVKCIQYLARQGLAFRGYEQGEGNLDQLIKFSAGMNEDLQACLSRNQDCTSPAIQNEMLAVMLWE